jgi:methylenetetrahydrofolate reductase (NADPH)
MTTTDGPIASVLNGKRPSLSFEFFPPKDEAGVESLLTAFGKLQKLNPDFVSVTYGAMGSNQESSLNVVERLAKEVPVIAHLTCIGSTRAKITSLLKSYESFGVAGVLALRGDLPKNFEGDPLGDFKNANELVALTREISDLEIGVSAFPEMHPESPNFAHDIQILKLKQDTGASFAITQMFFDLGAYFNLDESARAAGVTIPIVPGVMPIANAKQALRMAELSGAAVPPELLKSLKSAKDDQHARRIGMEFSIEFSKRLIAEGAPGLHVFTLNQFAAANELLEGIGLA